MLEHLAFILILILVILFVWRRVIKFLYWPSYEKILRLDISVDQMFGVDVLHPHQQLDSN